MQIIYWPDERLNQVSENVDVTFASEVLAQLEEAKKVLDSTKGMALSLIQVGIPKRAFIMKPKLEDGSYGDLITIINPVVIPQMLVASSDKYEGCLSAPNVYYKVSGRADSITISYTNEKLEQVVREFEGINAVCIQHELDHLNGIFFFERLSREDRRSAEKKWNKERKKLKV